MKRTFPFKKSLIGLAIALGVVVFATVLLPRIILKLQVFELISVDFRYTIRPVQEVGQDIVIIEIDNASLDKLNSWPWPRSYYAQLIRILNQHGAKVIGFDIMFDSKSGLGPQEDAQFSEALAEASNVILASKRVLEETPHYRMVSWDVPIKELRRHAPFGFVNEYISADNRIRHSWAYFFAGENTVRYSWDLQVLAKYLDLPLSDAIVDEPARSLIIGSRLIPFEGQGLVPINYRGPDRTFPIIPFYQVLEERYKNMEIFKDKIVLIGATDPVLHDFFYTPFGIMSGVEIHANTIRTYLDEQYIVRPIKLVDIGLILIIMGIFLVATLRTSARRGLWIAASISVAYSAIVVGLFLTIEVLVVWSYPLLLGNSVYLVVLITRFIREEKEKQKIKGVFQQYVSPSVVDAILKDAAKLKLGGEKRELTVFFSDIRSFTTYSEAHSAEEVVEILNDYLDAMTRTIFKWNGTLDKYVGDEIMAVWGAPLPQEDHAKLAVRCCWDQLAVLRKLQDEWRAKGRDILDIGMGVNTGEMIVGNIGSAMHKDYTVIGDAVNLGARLEAETRNFGNADNPCYLIISEFTYRYVQNIVTVENLGSVKVKGKNQSVVIYQVTDVKMTD